MVGPRAAVWLLAGLGVLAAAPVSSQIYRWTDAEGDVHFTRDLAEVPPRQRDAALAAAREPSRLQRYDAPAPPARREAGRLELPFERHGRMMVVQVRLNDRVSAPFVVDTGASDVAVPAHVARAAGIVVGPGTRRELYQTAAGLVASPVVTLESVEAGEVRLEGVRGHVAEEIEVGLLGATFFSNFAWRIDPAAGVIVLEPDERARAGLGEAQWRARFRTARERLEAVERYLEENRFTSEARVAELERSEERVRAELEALEQEADAAGVPRGWRE
jgi:clan AA aspartic protease (TIGR02281 family)